MRSSPQPRPTSCKRKEQIAAQATRMLEDEKARDLVRNFHTQWLQLTHLDSVTKDTAVYPAYQSSLRGLWKEEIQTFVEQVILEGDGSLGNPPDRGLQLHE